MAVDKDQRQIKFEEALRKFWFWFLILLIPLPTMAIIMDFLDGMEAVCSCARCESLRRILGYFFLAVLAVAWFMVMENARAYNLMSKTPRFRSGKRSFFFGLKVIIAFAGSIALLIAANEISLGSKLLILLLDTEWFSTLAGC